MAEYNEELFECVTEIVASTLEETSVSIDAQGGAAVAEYFTAIYTALAQLAAGKDPEEAEEDEEPEGEEEACARQPKYEVYKDGAGQYRFRLKAANGEIIAVSEGYKSKTGCLKGVASVQKCAVSGQVVFVDQP